MWTRLWKVSGKLVFGEDIDGRTPGVNGLDLDLDFDGENGMCMVRV